MVQEWKFLGQGQGNHDQGNWEIEKSQNHQYLILNADEMAVAVIKIQQSSCISSIRKSEYFPEFGLLTWRECLVVSQTRALLPWSLRTSISPMPAGVNVE